MKHSFLLFFIFPLALASFAQTDFGVKGGINFSNTINKSSMKPGFDLGVFARVGSTFYFQPEVNYSFRSSTLKEAFTEELKDFKMKSHNLDIPLLLGYKFVNHDNFNFRLFVGPRVGVQIGNNYNEQENTGTFHLMEYGGQCGIGIDFWRFMLDVKYDFSTRKYDAEADDSAWLNQNMINISLGFKIVK